MSSGLSLSTPAHAQAPAQQAPAPVQTPAQPQAKDFKTQYDEAVNLYKAQQFEEAIPKFKAAYELEPRPELLFNIGQSYRKTGHPREAIQYYERYMASDAQIDAETRRKVFGYVTEARNTVAAMERETNQRLQEEKARQEQLQKQQQAEQKPPPPTIIVQQVEQKPPPPPPTPVWKRWWFWTAIGGGVAAGLGIGLGVGLGIKPEPNRGTINF